MIKVRTLVALVLLITFALTQAGCVAAWFIGGAAAGAATAVAISDKNKKAQIEQNEASESEKTQETGIK